LRSPRLTEIVFQSDGLTLRGIFHEPDAPRPPFVVGSHGLFSNAESPKLVRLAESLAQNGVAFFRFDHRGCGKSEGDFVKVTSLEGRVEDLLSAVRILGSRNGTGPFLGLFGSSMGGATALAAATRIPVPALVTVAAPVRSREIRPDPNSENAPSADALRKTDAHHFDLTGHLPRIRNILCFHGDADETVPFSNARDILEHAGTPKRLIRLEGGDHRMTDPAHQTVFIAEATRWFTGASGASGC